VQGWEEEEEEEDDDDEEDGASQAVEGRRTARRVAGSGSRRGSRSYRWQTQLRKASISSHFSHCERQKHAPCK
jgi:hypothetical protein